MRIADDGQDGSDDSEGPTGGSVLLLLLNAGPRPVPFTLPYDLPGVHWKMWLDTSQPGAGEAQPPLPGRAVFRLPPRSLALFRQISGDQDEDAPESVARRGDRAVGHGIVETLIERLRSLRRLPTSTYRLQLNRAFTFADARSVVPYLQELGITDCYCSPVLQARPGSPHGYDICDHNSLNPDLGSRADFEALARELRDRGMGLILDVVPNHMSAWETSNAKWMDVLENGPSSPHAAFFDIDWHPLRSDTHLEDRVLLPILGDAYGIVLESQQLSLGYQDGAFFIEYFDHRLPLDPRSYLEILQPCADELVGQLDPDDEQLRELQSILTALTHLPDRSETDTERVQERQREEEVVKRRLRTLYDSSEAIREAVDRAVRLFAGSRGQPASFDRLDTLLERQPYRLAHWQVAAEEINYRRFFDINDLVALRQEDQGVFEETHRLVLELARERKVTGLRIDHPDGRS